jgi:ABC-type glycerol-3-phosphate transport system substrate-binding protein
MQVEMQQALTGDKTPKQALDDAAKTVANTLES